MTSATTSRSLQKAYPRDFTHLIAEVAETAIKAIVEPDPTRYIQETAVSGALKLKRLRCDLTPERRRDPALAAAFRCDIVRNRLVRDLAILLVEAHERLKRAENKAEQSAMSTMFMSTMFMNAVSESSRRRDSQERMPE